MWHVVELRAKNFEISIKLSANQLILPCKVLQHIIVFWHIILPRKGHRDEVNNFDLFLFYSFLVGQKFDFTTIVIGHMKAIHSAINIEALP